MDLDLFCPICLESLTEADSIGLPDSCAHAFCSECIIAWSKCSSSCPIDRLDFVQISVKELDGHVREILNVSDLQKDNDIGSSFVDNIVCEICRDSSNENVLLLCDGCNKGFHCYCLDPPLYEVPLREWFCESCNESESQEMVIMLMSSEPGPSSAPPPSLSSPHTRRSQRLRKRRDVPRTRFVERIRQYIQVSREFAFDSDDDQGGSRSSKGRKKTRSRAGGSMILAGPGSESDARKNAEIRRGIVDNLGLRKTRDCPGLSQFDIVKGSTGSSMKSFNKLDLTGSRCAPVASDDDLNLTPTKRKVAMIKPEDTNDFLGSLLKEQEFNNLPGYQLKVNVDGFLARKEKDDESLKFVQPIRPQNRSTNVKTPELLHQGLTLPLFRATDKTRDHVSSIACFSESFMTEPVFDSAHPECGSPDEELSGEGVTESSASEADKRSNAETVSAFDSESVEQRTGEAIESSNPTVNQSEQDVHQDGNIIHSCGNDEELELTAVNQNQVIDETQSSKKAMNQALLDADGQDDELISNRNDQIYDPFHTITPQSETEEPLKSPPSNQADEFTESQEFHRGSNHQEILEKPIPEVDEGCENIENNEDLRPTDVESEHQASHGSTELISNFDFQQEASIREAANKESADKMSRETENGEQSDAESNFSGFGSDDLNKYEQDNSQSSNLQPSLDSHSPRGNYEEPDKIPPPKKFEDTSCEICECNHDEATMLLCDERSCNRGFHMACLNPPLFDVPDGEWVCPTCRKSKEEAIKFQPPPFKSRNSGEVRSSANSVAQAPFRGYEIPKKSKNSDSRLSFSDLTSEEPSAEELEKLGLPVQFNMNNLLKSQENEDGPFGRDPEGRNDRAVYEGRFDYHSRGWNFGRPPLGGGRGGRWEMDRGNRGPPFDRNRGGGGFGGRFPGDRDKGDFRNRDGFRNSRWGNEQKNEFPFTNTAAPPFHQPQHREPPLELVPNSTEQQEQITIPEQNIEKAGEDPIFPPQEKPVTEQEEDTKTTDTPAELDCPPAQRADIEETTVVAGPSRKRELSNDKPKDKEDNKEKTIKESRRRSRSKSSESRKRKRDRSSSRKRSDEGDRRRDRRKSRDHDRHRSRRSRSRSKKRYDSDRHSRHDDRRSSRDHRSRDSRHDRNDDRRSSRYDDDRRRSDYSRSNEPSRSEINTYDQPGSSVQTPGDLNIGANDQTPNPQVTPTKDEQQPEPVLQMDAPPEVPQMVAPPEFGGFQRPFGGFSHRFEGERPRFRSSFTPIQNRFQRPPRQGFNPRFPDAMPPFNAMHNAPLPDQQFNSLLGQGLNARFMSPDLMRGALPNALNGNLAFPNRFPGAAINSPQNLLNTRLPFPFNNAAANNVNPLGPPGTIDPNVLQQFANTLANNATASTQSVQPIDDVQKLINSQANILQVQQQQQQQQSSQDAVTAAANSTAQTNVAALLRQIESNKLLQSVTSLNTPDNSAQLFPTSPKQLNPPPVQDSTPEPPIAQQNTVVGTSISPISISLAKVQSNMPMINSILETHFQNQQQPPGVTPNPLQQIFGGNTSFPSQNSSPELVEMEDSVVSPRADSKPEKESVPFLDQLVRNVTSPTIPFMSGADDSVKSENAPSKPLVKPVIPKLDSDDEKNSDIEASANEMQLKKKMTDRSELQTKVADLVKGLLMPHFKKKTITKDEYKDIMRKSVNKVVKRGSTGSSQLKEEKIGKLVNAYVDHYKVKRSKGSKAAAAVVDPDF